MKKEIYLNLGVETTTLRRILKARRALSPILATLLLIVIAVAAITVTYAWMTSYIDNTTQQAGVMLYEANVAFTSDKITVDIGNSGTSDTTILAAYVGTSASTEQNQLSWSVSLAAGNVISFNITYPWTAGTKYYFKVVSTAGQQALTFQVQAPQTSPASSSWWNPQYSYRQLITVTNNAASTLPAGYSVEVNLDTASLVADGKMLADCSDLRIVYWQGVSWVELDRDIINSGTSATQVWFKTQAAIASSPSTDSNYYLYYGNPAATNPPANKSNVYLWFDDFNRPNEPNITSESAYKQTNGGTWSIENGMLKNIGATGDPNKLLVNALGTVNYGVEMSIKLKVTNWIGNTDEARMGLTCNVDSQNGEGYCGLFHQNQNTAALLNDLRSWGTSTTFAWTTDTLYNMQFKVTNPSTGQGELKIWQDGTSEPASWTLQGNFGGTARNYGELGIAGSRQADTTYFDDFQVRYAADIEPTVNISAPQTPN